jgi:pteridine reductase
VTGGAIRVGAAITTGLLEAGYRVLVHCHRSIAAAHALVDAHPGAVGPCEADLACPRGRAALVSAVLDPRGPTHGRLDLLVHNAASFEHGRFEDRTDADLERVLALNLVAPLSLTRALLPALRSSTGSVVHIVDLGAFHPWPGRLDHCVSKAALGAATRGLVAELAPVRVNAVAPGRVLAPVGDGPVDDTARPTVGTAADVAAAVLYLARAPAVCGHTLVLDGGETAHGPRPR